MKNIVTPATLINAPITSSRVIFCLKIIKEGMIIKIGTIDIIVEAIPVAVY